MPMAVAILANIAAAPTSRQNKYMHACMTRQSCFQPYILYVSEVTQSALFTSPHMSNGQSSFLMLVSVTSPHNGAPCAQGSARLG